MKFQFIIGLCTFALCISGCSTKKYDLSENSYINDTDKYQEFPVEQTTNTYTPSVCCDNPCGCSYTDNEYPKENHATANNNSQSNIAGELLFELINPFKPLRPIKPIIKSIKEGNKARKAYKTHEKTEKAK